MSEARVATSVFCDDIRMEVGNKFSIMGIYSGDIIINHPQQPTLLPKLGAVVFLITDLNDIPEHISISVYLPPNRTELLKMEMDVPKLEHQEDAVKAQFRSIVVFPPVTLTEEGFIEITINTGREELRAGRLFVRFVPPPDVSPTQLRTV
jgi:uncharacterized protein DUF6941